MSFQHPWFLLFALLPLAWLVYEWRAASKRLQLLFKALSFAALLTAFAEPVITLPQTRLAEVVLVDTSASVGSAEIERASTEAADIAARRGRNLVKIVPFESSVRNVLPAESEHGLRLQPVALDRTIGTNIEDALSGSVAALPAGYVPRVVLLSDGNENQGSVLRAIAQLQSLHISVDTIPLGAEAANSLRVDSLSIPREASSGEEIPIELKVTSPRSIAATLDISAEGKLLGHEQVELIRGTNHVHATVRVQSSGVVGLSGRLAAGSSETQFQEAIRLLKPRVLYLSEDPAGTDANLLAALAQANVEIVRNAGEIDRDLASYELVILNNLDLGSIPAERKQKLEEYVKGGGGLLLIGGERQIYKEDKQLDALDRALPAKLAPPDLPKGTCVALIIDKSSSMEGRKIELARLSASGVVDHLKPTDSIGVLIFDNSFQWAVPMRRAEDKSLIKRLISGITPDGGTQIAPALNEAYRRVLPSNATFKHIVLMTDGISEEGDSIELAQQAAQNNITISTVGLGQDVNRTYLEKIASTSGGRSYFLNEPAGLEQILLKDVETYSNTTAVEKALTPIVAEKSDVLDDTDMEHAPALKGYARYIAKPGSEILLGINTAKHDPLYVRWQYGLGRAAVFASDAKSRWAENWIAWPGFDKFWINATRDLLEHTRPVEASAEFDSADGDLVVHYRLSEALPEPKSIPTLYVLGPNQFREPLTLRQVEGRSYEGRLHLGTKTGLFRIRPETELAAFPEVGLYRHQPELEDRGVNTALLKEISQATGGRYNPSLSQIFSTQGARLSVPWQLWPFCLALALALTIAELITRKWAGLRQLVSRA